MRADRLDSLGIMRPPWTCVADVTSSRMAEHHRVNGQLSRQIVLREAAILALPPQLRAEAMEPDFESYPVRRCQHSFSTILQGPCAHRLGWLGMG